MVFLKLLCLTGIVYSLVHFGKLFKLAGVALHMSSSYHPQSDGQTERLNQSMETFIRCFVNACPSKWSNWLASAEFWYNSNPCSAIVLLLDDLPLRRYTVIFLAILV